MNSKYSIGQLVQPGDGHLPSKIVGIRVAPDGSITYSVAAKHFDQGTEELLEGVRHYTEEELSEVVESETQAETPVNQEAPSDEI